MADNMEEIVVHIRGLPADATAKDILNFFEGVPIRNGEDGIHFILKEGKPSSEAYVELQSQEDLFHAGKKHRQNMGQKYVQVLSARRSQMEYELKRCKRKVCTLEDGCVRLRGLPFGCSKEELIYFFSGLEIVSNGIFLPIDYRGRQTGDAYIQFASKEIAEKALEKDKETIGYRYIEIFRSSLEEIGIAKKKEPESNAACCSDVYYGSWDETDFRSTTE